jgi:hypothetical protein
MKHNRIAAWVLLGSAALGLFALPVSYANGPKTPAKEVTFNKDIAPIFTLNAPSAIIPARQRRFRP